MRNVSLHAVSIGGLADVVGTFVSTTVAVFVIGMATLDTAGPIQSSGGLMPLAAPWYFAVTFVFGTLWSVIAGYIAAWIAKREEVLHGALSSYFCVALGIYGLVAGHGTIPLWMHVFGFTAAPALGALGGLLRARQTNRAQGVSP